MHWAEFSRPFARRVECRTFQEGAQGSEWVLQVRKMGCWKPCTSAGEAVCAFHSLGAGTLTNTGFITTAGLGKIGNEPKSAG